MRLCIILVFFVLNAQAQDYITYHRRVNEIRNLILQNDYPLALAHYDTIRNDFDFIFANDCFRALQLAIQQKDDERSMYWLKKSFSRGIPLWYFEMNEITSPFLRKMDREKVSEMFQDCRRNYLSSIDTALRKTLDGLLEIDQAYTDKVNDAFWPLRVTLYNWQWKKNNHRQFPVLIHLIQQHGYPGEKLIGLNISNDSTTIRYHQFHGPDFTEGRMETMLIHCYSDPRKIHHELFFKEVQKGNMPPEQFAIIHDFIAKYGKGKFGDFGYYNYWHQDPDTTRIDAINTRRKAIGLSNFETQQSLRKLITNYRKEKVVNREISLY